MNSTTTTPGPDSIGSKSKLPIKRKPPNPGPDHDFSGSPTPPPFKFHRIWTEPDEIRFLQGLLHSATQNLSFPRDLHIYYSRFADSMPQPYTRSQLSEKLRRLRRKFRNTSLRLGCRGGGDVSLLSRHDRALFDLSKRLWGPEYVSLSPFGNKKSNGSNHNNLNDGARDLSGLVSVEVDFSATLPVCSRKLTGNDNSSPIDVDNGGESIDCDDGDRIDVDNTYCQGEVEMKEVNDTGVPMENSGGIDALVAKAASNVFDQSMKGIRNVFARKGLPLLHQDSFNCLQGCSWPGPSQKEDWEGRWREQILAELDVFSHRLSLALADAFNRRH